jgi:hypothetical protein
MNCPTTGIPPAAIATAYGSFATEQSSTASEALVTQAAPNSWVIARQGKVTPEGYLATTAITTNTLGLQLSSGFNGSSASLSGWTKVSANNIIDAIETPDTPELRGITTQFRTIPWDRDDSWTALNNGYNVKDGKYHELDVRYEASFFLRTTNADGTYAEQPLQNFALDSAAEKVIWQTAPLNLEECRNFYAKFLLTLLNVCVILPL